MIVFLTSPNPIMEVSKSDKEASSAEPIENFLKLNQLLLRMVSKGRKRARERNKDEENPIIKIPLGKQI
ncbi:hypothetical protein CEXT_429941 [Caerostris extrusa]|uniref:Uncharacterized protein n=1 Tax=Caerostris extrusa TaxID=172846 RepID=A0AAV4SI74_CAEEX|nr:hypothetical protein CEXT_429941 [Caerostris extrusa]